MERNLTFSSWSLTTIYLFVYFAFYFFRDGIWVTIMWLANRCRLEHEYQGKLIIPLQPNISMHILHTVLDTFPEVLTRRICLKIKSFISWWSFPWFSWPRCVIQGWYCKEKLKAGQGILGEGKRRKNGELFPGLNAVTKSAQFTKISQTIDEVYGVNSRVTTKAPPKFTNITKFTMIAASDVSWFNDLVPK